MLLQDRALYEELARRGSRGRLFWLAGDWLLKAGLGGILLLLVVWPAVFYLGIADAGLALFLLLLPAAAAFTAGSFLKRLAYKAAAREGLDVAGILRGRQEKKN